MKKMISMLLCAGLLLMTLAGCAEPAASTPADPVTLYDQGLELVSLMKEMAESPEYLNALTGNPAIREKLAGAAPSDPAGPAAVYELKIRGEDLMQLLGLNSAELTDRLNTALMAKSCAAVASQLNAQGGAELLAASSLCTASSSVVNPEFAGNTLYLYVYPETAPVLTAFSAEDGVVTATASFILLEDFRSASAEEVQAFLADLPVKVAEVQP